ncbi:calcium-translocating P-type ATPase [Heliocybe sulcata]|uniref:Calcium-transporting ATPase n=1 Tax=Heliocybe sulcata TaxID=5364 RepID=A0A5C3MWP7_9AGAM|nr:calcium-translocating P-type ATPase [Heliocybe sulcata]
MEGRPIPAIVTSEFGDEDGGDHHPPQPSTPPLDSPPHNQQHHRSPSDPQFLSPLSILKPSHSPRNSLDGHNSMGGRLSLDVPGSPHSPAPSDDGASSFGTVPPSPTLSARSSVHFADQASPSGSPKTTLALRHNNPGDGLTSLNILGHGRKGSNASNLTYVSDATAKADSAEGHDQYLSVSDGKKERRGSDAHSQLSAASPTQTYVDSASERSPSRSRSRNGVKGKSSMESDLEMSPRTPSNEEHDPIPRDKGKSKQTDGDDEEGEGSGRPGPIDASQDIEVNPEPFEFRPLQLASLVDPKSLEALEALGGAQGLMRGLGTTEKGLSAKGTHEIDHGGGDGKGAGKGNSQRHEPTSKAGGGGGEPPKTHRLPPLIKVTSTGSNEEDLNSQGEEDDDVHKRHNNESDEDGSFDGHDEKGPVYSAGMDERKRVYGANVLPHRASKSLLQLMWLALKDKVLILLSIAAIVSLALGLFQDFGTPRPAGEPPVDWVEGVAICVAILIVVMVGSVNDWQKERQFKTLNEKKEERGVKVIRSGLERVIDVREVVVGDICLLEPGEIVPCDGVFLSGHNVKCDESGATGESDAIKKVSYEECIAMRDKEGHEPNHTDCFIVSGSKVLEGVGTYVVIAVGQKSFNGRIMMALRGDSENTPLQLKLNDLAELIAKLGSMAGLLLFTALMIRFFVQLGTNEPQRTASQKGIAFVQILIISVTLVVVAVPEGLPLAVTLALAFATKRMTSEKLLVRVLGSCETMANASVVCTDKTGTLTQNVMTVVAGSVGIHAKFVKRLEENQARTNADEEVEGAAQKKRRHADDFSIDETELQGVLSPPLAELFNASIAINSTAFEDDDPESGEKVFVGSKTETALLKFAKELGWPHYAKIRSDANIVQMVPFSSDRKAMGVVVRMPNGVHRLYLKGASEILTKMCNDHVMVYQRGAEEHRDAVEKQPIDDLKRENIDRTIIFYANQTLRTIAMCYRDYESWPPAGARQVSEDEVEYEDIAKDMTLIGIVGIEDPVREGVRTAVADCHRAGVTVKMCTGDNVLTARSIALQCGIYTKGGIIMEGPIFRQLSKEERMDVVSRLQVLARSSPEDKKILVESLKELGEIVGVTGDGTNDGPALKTADVGFSMGIAGTEVAKEASDIILMDDNFASIVKAIMWGRCVNDSVRKFLQFQISANITAVLITFISAVASSSETSVLSAVQLLWINIIMDTFAALALATDPASPALLNRKPESKTAPLFSVDMYKQIAAQSAYQTTITLIFHFLGLRILGLPSTSHNDDIVQTLVFNIFVFAQIFNSVNCRRLDRRLNVFEGVSRNYYFIGITLIEVAVQVLIVFVGGAAFQVTQIGGTEWGISIALGFGALLIGSLVRLIPNGPVTKLFIKLRLLPNPNVLPTQSPLADAESWNRAIDLVRDNLGTFAKVRGGRMRGSSFVGKSRNARMEQGRVVPSLLTMVPTLVASSIGAGWQPQGGSLSDPAHNDPSRSTAALWEGKFQIHPDTPADDPFLKKWGGSGVSRGQQ